MSLIEVERLNKNYFTDGVPTGILRDVNLKVEENEFVAIMGPSGSGKSTLLHILGFLERPSSGIYRFDGKQIDEYSDDELAEIRNRKIGFVFQAFNLLARQSVFENVAIPLIYAGISSLERKKIIEETVEMVGLGHRLHYETSKLSGGEKQRVAMARALVNNPRMILADEPTGNLDSQSGGIVMDTLKQLNQKGHAVVLVTHESYTASYASRIVHLLDGQVEREELVARRIDEEKTFIK
ncbi:MAG TPA: ABC transporter ATP-binding protein [Patescibacteria group bacterium]|nr:ABC transporter ATP-binding protein [Patescibacteria group bacterium]